jgi:hypothetical protein
MAFLLKISCKDCNTFNANGSGIKLIFAYLKKLIEMIEILNL